MIFAQVAMDRPCDHRFFISTEKKIISYVPQKCGWATYFKHLIRKNCNANIHPLYSDMSISQYKSHESFFHYRNPCERLSSAIADKLIEARDPTFLKKIKNSHPDLHELINLLTTSITGAQSRLESKYFTQIIDRTILDLESLEKSDMHFKIQTQFIKRYKIDLAWFDHIVSYRSTNEIVSRFLGQASKDQVVVANRSLLTNQINDVLRSSKHYISAIQRVYAEDYAQLNKFF